MYFLLSHCVKSYGNFVKFWLFYDACSPNMIMSRDPRSKFLRFLFCPDSTFNVLGKVTKFLVEKLSTSKLSTKNLTGGGEGGWKTLPRVPSGLRFLTPSNFQSQLLLKFKEIGDADLDFYELKQCQKNIWIEKNVSCEQTLT